MEVIHRHFVVHKPLGFLSQFIWVSNKKKKLLGELYDFPEGTMSIGRLDKLSEGLLFLTTDGKVSEQVRSKKVEKEYYVQLDGEVTEEAIIQMEEGVEIGVSGEKYITLPCKARKLYEVPDFPPRARKIRGDHHGPTSWAAITITEGKNRQVRKMTAAVGFPTLRLIRVRIGEIMLDSLKAGEVREIEDFGKLERKNILEIKKTTSEDKDLVSLIQKLDAGLQMNYGTEVQGHYDQFNTLAAVEHFVICYSDDQPVACGGIKTFDDQTMEIKRMYVDPSQRGKGIATKILLELELLAKELGHCKTVLETGTKQDAAIALYLRNGYKEVPKYGQYIDLPLSICFGKDLS